MGSADNLTDRLAAVLEYLTPEELRDLDELLAVDATPWRPLPGPQAMAWYSDADQIGFGGQAGGGKTDLACGMALLRHTKSGMFRENGTELVGLQDRLIELIGDLKYWHGKDKLWRIPRAGGRPVQIELGSFPNVGDERKYQGRPHDFLAFDEAANMREAQVRFLMGWLRTTQPGQRIRVLYTFNPPTTIEGRWIIKFFAPWLDSSHRNPAAPGELRWFARIGIEEVEVASGGDFHHNGKTIRPRSRTFIPSRLKDNPYLLATDYESVLQGLPEPLRSQMLEGNFSAGIRDDEWQVIPTEWVQAAQARWAMPTRKEKMDSIGVDVARGGRDNTEIARRHGMWFDVPLHYPGTDTPNGPVVAGLVVAATRNGARQHIELNGPGISAYDFLQASRQPVVPIDVSRATQDKEQTGILGFYNVRSAMWWKMREALDPQNNTGICLPPDPGLLEELTTPTWSPSGSKIRVMSREEIIKKVGRSVDRATAYCLALFDTPEYDIQSMRNAAKAAPDLNYDPWQMMNDNGQSDEYPD